MHSSEMMSQPVEQLHSCAESLIAKFKQGGGTSCIDEAIDLDRGFRNTILIAQEHKGMSCLVGDSRRQVLDVGDKALKWFKYKQGA